MESLPELDLSLCNFETTTQPELSSFALFNLPLPEIPTFSLPNTPRSSRRKLGINDDDELPTRSLVHDVRRYPIDENQWNASPRTIHVEEPQSFLQDGTSIGGQERKSLPEVLAAPTSPRSPRPKTMSLARETLSPRRTRSNNYMPPPASPLSNHFVYR